MRVSRVYVGFSDEGFEGLGLGFRGFRVQG